MKPEEALQRIMIDGGDFRIERTRNDITRTKYYSSKLVEGQIEVLSADKVPLIRIVTYTTEDSSTIHVLVKLSKTIDLRYEMLYEFLNAACYSNEDDIEKVTNMSIVFDDTPWLEDKEYCALTERDKYYIYLRDKWNLSNQQVSPIPQHVIDKLSGGD